MDILGLLSFIFVLSLLGFFMYQTLKLMLVSKNLASQVVQSNLDKEALLTKLDQEINKVQPIDQTEGFIKFLSSSRDAAFIYIEEVQKSLIDFKNNIEPEIDYYKTYGSAIDSPHTTILNKIVNAYDELVKVLPEENPKEKNG